MAAVFVTRELPGDELARLRDAGHAVDVWAKAVPPSRDALRRRTGDAVGLLSLLTDRVDSGLLDACPRLRVVANLAVGCDNIDVAAAAARGIAVGNTPDVLTDSTADLAFALILAALRRLPEGIAAVRDGSWTTWDPGWLLGSDAHGSTLGIIGRGRIGHAVARRAAGFDMTVLHHNRSSGIALDELLERSDVVSLHCPLTEETRGLVDEAFLRAMRPDAILVNTARGRIVDQIALTTALREGWIGGAALDVTDPEPLPAGDALLAAPNLIVLPHLGSATRATRERMAALAVDNLLAGLSGSPLPHAVEVPA